MVRILRVSFFDSSVPLQNRLSKDGLTTHHQAFMLSSCKWYGINGTSNYTRYSGEEYTALSTRQLNPRPTRQFPARRPASNQMVRAHLCRTPGVSRQAIHSPGYVIYN
jgi:hypothetical protein